MNSIEYKNLKPNDILIIQYRKNSPLFAVKLDRVRTNTFEDLYNCYGSIIYHQDKTLVGNFHSFSSMPYRDFYLLKKVKNIDELFAWLI